MGIPSRSLKNIRTLSARVNPSSVSYRSYMQITCLEMEKVRRATERNKALARIAELDARLAQIEQEKCALLEAVERRRAADPSRPPAIETRREAMRRTGFRIRY